MNFDYNRKYNTIAIYVIIVVAVSSIIVYAVSHFTAITRFFGEFSNLLTPFIVGFVIAYILNPILNAFEKHAMKRLFAGRLSQRANRILSMLLTYLVTLVLIGVFFSIVIPQIASSIASIAGQVPGWFYQAQQFANDMIVKYNLQDFQTVQPEAWDQIMNAVTKLTSTASDIVTNAIPHVWQATMTVTASVMNVILGVIISIYILLSKERFFAQIKKLLSAVIPAPVVGKAVDITHQSHEIFSGFISGKLLDSAIIGVLCFIGMSVLRIPYAMLISVIVGVTNIIPYFGPFIGAIPSILILLIISPVKAIWFGVFVLALQQLDGNVIGPKILGDSTGLSAFWVIFSITVFGSLMGVVGMFIGVPLFAVIYSLVRQFVEWRLRAKGMPTATADYASDKHALLGSGGTQKQRKPLRWRFPPLKK